METDERLTRIYTLLYALGVRANLRGFRYVSCAIALVLQNPERLARPSERIYPEVGRLYHAEPEDVMRDMRRLVFLIWKRSPEELEEMAGKPFPACPTTKQFLAFACRYLAERDDI